MSDLINDKVKERVMKYLSRDEKNIRKTVLNLFLNGSKFTTIDIYYYLINRKFHVSYRGVSAMVGLMNTRLGILSINVTGNHNIYSIKENYKDTIKYLLEKENK